MSVISSTKVLSPEPNINAVSTMFGGPPGVPKPSAVRAAAAVSSTKAPYSAVDDASMKVSTSFFFFFLVVFWFCLGVLLCFGARPKKNKKKPFGFSFVCSFQFLPRRPFFEQKRKKRKKPKQKNRG